MRESEAITVWTRAGQCFCFVDVSQPNVLKTCSPLQSLLGNVLVFFSINRLSPASSLSATINRNETY